MVMDSSEGISKFTENIVANLSDSSIGIPTDKDFNFYNNFSQFSRPISEINYKSKQIIEKVMTQSQLWSKPISFPEDSDDEESGEWLVNINDDVLEKLASSLDETEVVKIEESESRVQKSESNVVGVKKVAIKGKPKVPFHIPTIPKPQDVYKIIVNNTNQPFEHVEFVPSDFVVGSIVGGIVEVVKPVSLEMTPFKFVEDVNDLKELVKKLASVDEFAVDLEHNQYRSFQGLTCLMQISTRTEDFVVDTLKLHDHIGPYLRDVFKDCKKKKVMHGADRDILWLQRDFGIYVCNMFDTGQASRVLKMERNSLEYLLQHFCGVVANKEYQNADWRLRPLPVEMMRYAREDTHYLLYIYDVMRMKLLSESADNGSRDVLLTEVYKRSYDICMQLYEKELLTDTSYQHIYGLIQGGDFNAEQLAVVAGLHRWRDNIARAEDESTGYVLPNKTLLEIAKRMPLTTSKLKRCMKSKHPYVERNLGSVVGIIRESVQNSAAYQEAVEHLKERRLELQTKENIVATEGAEMSVVITEPLKASVDSLDAGDTSERRNEYGGLKATSSVQVEVTIQKPKRRGLGMLLAQKRKLKEPEEIQAQQIKSSMSLPFHAFSGSIEQEIQQAATGESVAADCKLDDIITLETGSDDLSNREQENSFSMPLDVTNNQPECGENKNAVSVEDMDEEGDEKMSSSLSSRFKKCRKSKVKHAEKPQANVGQLKVKPFDYEAARKQVVFGEDPGKKQQLEKEDDDSHKRKKNDKGDKKKKNKDIFLGQPPMIEDAAEFQQGKRRQAFPASGNRSYTFR